MIKIHDFSAAVLTKLDESVGKVVAALGARGLLENSIIIFTTDNGGAAAGFNDNAASNYPLRGVSRIRAVPLVVYYCSRYYMTLIITIDHTPLVLKVIKLSLKL